MSIRHDMVSVTYLFFFVLEVPQGCNHRSQVPTIPRLGFRLRPKTRKWVLD